MLSGRFVPTSACMNSLQAAGVRVTWFGHSSELVEIDGVTVLIDPVWDDRAAPVRFMGPKRFFAPTLLLDELPPVDAVLISHDHYDHLGKQTVKKLAKMRPELRWVCPLGVARELHGFGVAAGRVDGTRLDAGDSGSGTVRRGTHGDSGAGAAFLGALAREPL